MTWIGPVILVTLLSFIKELIDEISRWYKDNRINSQKYLKMTQNNDFISIRSDCIQVGDFIKVTKNQRIPADMVLLSSSEDNGTAFV